MLGLFRRGVDSRPRACAPPGLVIYAVGDIHGRADLLAELHRAILSDAARTADRKKLVVYIGDYVDRGADSRGVIDILIGAPLTGFDYVFLMGNHEATFLDFLEDISVGSGWLRWGGEGTLRSYGVLLSGSRDNPRALAEAQSEIRSKLPAAHLAFLRGLSLSHQEGDYFFGHAGVRPGVPLQAQSPEDLMWIREPFLSSKANHGRVVVHGHSISREVTFRPNRIGIDTGAYASGILTCLVLEEDRQRLLQTGNSA